VFRGARVWLGSVLLLLAVPACTQAAPCTTSDVVTVRAPHGVRKAAVFLDGRRDGSVRRGKPRQIALPGPGATLTVRLVGRTRKGRRVRRVIEVTRCPVDSGVIEPGNAKLRYEGRWDVRAGRATTVNSGSRIFLRFTGDTVTGIFDAAGMKHPAQIYTWVDGKRSARRKADRKRIRLTPDGLAAGTHTLVLAVKDVSQEGNRWKPPLNSALHVTGLDLGTGVLEAADPAPDLRFTFIGDSITEGVGARCIVDSDGVEAPAGTPEGSDCTDATIDYAWRTAGEFGAQLEQVGFGEQGVTTAGAGNVPPAPQTVALNFSGSPATPFAAEVVVINLGTNDFLANASTEAIRKAYLELLGAVRARYPDARVLALGIFGAGGTDTGSVNDAIRDAVFAFGDLRTVFVSTRGWLSPVTDFTDSIHPNDNGHRAATERLAQTISGITGLQRVRPVDAPPN
jgi:lysophospholipase L1-like esterase